MATSPRVRSAEPSVCRSAILEPPRDELSRPLSRAGVEIVLSPRSHVSSGRQYDDLVGNALDLSEVVADEDHREAEPSVQIPDEFLDPAPRGLVEGARGLIEQEHLRFEGEGAGHSDALLLSDGEGLRIAPGQRVVQPHHLEQPSRVRVLTREARPVENRLLDRVAEERGDLEDHSNPPPQLQRVQGARRLPVQVDLPRRRSIRRLMARSKLLFPAPEGPTTAVILPSGILASTPLRIST